MSGPSRRLVLHNAVVPESSAGLPNSPPLRLLNNKRNIQGSTKIIQLKEKCKN